MWWIKGFTITILEVLVSTLTKSSWRDYWKNIKKELLENVSTAELLKKSLSKNNIEYVANFTSEAREKIRTSEWTADTFIDMKTKAKDAKRIDNFLKIPLAI